MNIIKQSMHIGITVTSFAGFLTGWACLAQADRLAVQASAQSGINLAPIQNVDNLLHTLSTVPSGAQELKINPTTPTPLPQPTPTIQPQARVPLYKPPLRTSGS